MRARITSAGKVFQLDRPAEPDETVTEDDVADRGKLSRLLLRILKSLALLTRRFEPRCIDFEDRAVTSGSVLRLTHSFGTRVRWWLVDWKPTTPGDIPIFERSGDTNVNTLCLVAGNNGTATVRVEEAG